MDGVWLGPGTGRASQLALHTDPQWNPAGHPPYCGRTLPDSGCPGVVSYPPRAARSLLLSIERYCDGMVREVLLFRVPPWPQPQTVSAMALLDDSSGMR